MASPIVPSTPQLQQLTLNQKFQYIQNAKAETEVLQQHITHIRKQIMDTSCKFFACEFLIGNHSLLTQALFSTASGSRSWSFKRMQVFSSSHV